jgi:hypothetical protein
MQRSVASSLLSDDIDSSIVKRQVLNWTEGVQFPAGVYREADHESSVGKLNMYSEMKELRAKYTYEEKG